jgi:hypothetical protein
MIRNQSYFRPPLEQETYLRARGFSPDGLRSGGLVRPVEVMLPIGTVLFRLFHDAKRRFGEWWFTAHEMKLVVDYFGRGAGSGFADGRTVGKGILHGVLAVRHEWGGSSARHLGEFFIVRLQDALLAYAGEGDEAPDTTQTQNLKPVLIIGADGQQRAVRQVFLPKTWEYTGAFLEMGRHPTDTHLPGAVAKHDRGAMYFEP